MTSLDEAANELLDSEGELALVVSAPIPVAPLPRIGREPLIVSPTGGTILERAGHAQEQIRHDVGAITGSIIAPVTIRLTGAQIRDVDRVK